MARVLSILATLAVVALSGCAATQAQGKARPSFTPPAEDRTYRTPEEATAAFETVSKLAGKHRFRYTGNGHWQILNGDQVVREIVLGGRADIDWNN